MPPGTTGRTPLAPVPCVVVGHGFDGVREQRLDAYAERFAAAGLAVLVFDYRFIGSSEGEPRQLFDNKAQLADWRAAIECARKLEGVDPERIALWGTSTSGGHVVQLASEDARIAAVVAQVPLVDGLAQLFGTPVRQTVRLLWAGLKDRIGAALRPRPAADPGRRAARQPCRRHQPGRAQRPGRDHPSQEHLAQRGGGAVHARHRDVSPRALRRQRELPAARVPRRRRPARASQAGAEDGASGRAGRAAPLPGRPFRDVLRPRVRHGRGRPDRVPPPAA